MIGSISLTGKLPPDISGMRFQMLTAIALKAIMEGKQRWLCRCECGVEKVIARGELTSGSTKSCGCARKSAYLNTHGLPDVAGKKFGRWTVVSLKSGTTRWVAKCECGTVRTVFLNDMRRGKTKSCGCLRREVVSRIKSSHGHTRHGARTPEYSTWVNMINRCTNPREKSFKNYGGRGILVCERWNSFENFLADMGPKPRGMTLERKDVNGNYEPSNCDWDSRLTQANNKRNNRTLSDGTRAMTLARWGRETRLAPETISNRIKRGWTVPTALSAPLKTRH